MANRTQAQLETALLNAANTYNMNQITTVVNSLNTAEKALVRPGIYDVALNSIADYSRMSPGTMSDALSTSTARNFMSRVGVYASGDGIGRAIVTLSLDHNFTGLDAVTDYLTAPQKSNISPASLSITLRSVADFTTYTPGTTTDAAAANAVRDLMTKLGGYMQPADLGYAMASMSRDNNHAGIDAITDYLTGSQKAGLSQGDLNATLLNVVAFTNSAPGTSTDAASTAAIRDLMNKLGAYMPASALGNAMQILSYDHNFAGLDALTDYLTTSQKAGLAQGSLANTLMNITDYSYDYYNLPGTTTDAATANAIRDLMSKVGSFMPVSAIGYAMSGLAFDHNFAGLDAVTDYLTASQKAGLSLDDLHQTMMYTVNYTDATSGTATDVVTTNAVRDLMSKVGSFMSSDDIGYGMLAMAHDHNFAGLDAVTDYLTLAQKAGLSASWAIHGTLSSIADYTTALPGTASDEATTNALRDIMGKIGVYADQYTIADIAVILTMDHNYAGLAAVLDSITDQTASYANSMDGAIFNSNSVKVLMGGNDIYGGSADNDVIYSRGGYDTVHGNNGNDSLYGGTYNDILYGDSGNDTLVGGLGGDQLWGGVGADKFVFESTGMDTIRDFSAAQGDKLDFSSLLEKFDPSTHAITDFILKTTVNGSTTLSIDADGKGAGLPYAAVVLDHVATVDIQALFNNGQIIA
jgi:Ca2+-binding RTX toxin-like protein